MIFAMDIMELMAELLKENLTYSVWVVLFLPDWSLQFIVEFRYINSEQCINDPNVTPQYGTDSTSVMDKSTCLICKGKNQTCELIWVTHRAVSIWRHQEPSWKCTSVCPGTW